ncbi:MAG TPA: PAS domain-containing sensor histidine kinase [Bacteroidia bacterium]|nr:PAS domain-containing sensor histidine kinase [Bacteroidia bacterium]
MKTTEVSTETLNKLLELSEALVNGDYSKRVVVGIENGAINKIINNFNKLADNYFLTSNGVDNKKFNISSFIDIISSFSNHEFAKRIPISNQGTILDAIALGINMLGDELEQSVVSKEELERERDRLNQAQSIAKIGSWEYNLITTKLTGSDELYRIYELEPGYPDELAEVYVKKYHPDDFIKLLEEIKTTSEKGTGFSYEHRIFNNDKSLKYLAGIGEAIKNGQGKIIGIKGTVQDITDRKNAEINLNNSFNIVTEQNNRLSNFSYIVSHNLQSHTGNIHSLLKFFETAKSEAEKEILLKHLKTASGLLNETILHLNEVITIQNNKSLLIEPLNLHNYVNKAIDVLNDKISLKKAVVKNNVPKKTIIDYNPAYLESIILNFLSNAIKYSHSSRQPVVLLDYIKDKNNAILQITDNGIGIDIEKYGKHLFGMYKVFHTNKDARGIGLFISKNQIEAMGGKIELTSEVNKGTTFSIYIK